MSPGPLDPFGERRGLLIALEGLDGVGKSTLATALAASIGAETLAMPGMPRSAAYAVFTAFGADPTSRCVFLAACARALGLRARRVCAEGRDVVVDRYWLSSLAYARARGVTLDLSPVEAGIPVPDVTFVVMLAEAERRQRLLLRGPTDADRETMAPGFADRALFEMQDRPTRGAFAPTHCIDTTGFDASTSRDALLAALGPGADPPTPPRQGS